MTMLKIILDGDGSFPEFTGRPVHQTENLSITALAGGMSSGAPSVAVIAELEDGSFVFAQTSLALFLNAADALKARHGDPRPPKDLALQTEVNQVVAAALGVCGTPWPCIKPKDHLGRCATLVEVCSNG